MTKESVDFKKLVADARIEVATNFVEQPACRWWKRHHYGAWSGVARLGQSVWPWKHWRYVQSRQCAKCGYVKTRTWSL